MRKVVVRDATLHLDDERTGRHWQADSVDATLERNSDGLAGDLSLATLIGARTPEIHASYRYWSADRMLDFTLEFGAVEPAAFATLTPDLAPLAAVEVPISGTVRTRIDVAGATTEGFRVDLGIGKGSLKSALLRRDLKWTPETTVAALKEVSFVVERGESFGIIGVYYRAKGMEPPNANAGGRGGRGGRGGQ